MQEAVQTYMIAVGEFHQKMSELTKPRVEQCTGLTVELLTEGDPFDLKLKLLERTNKTILFVDADAVMVGWDWQAVELSRLNACYEQIDPSWPGFEELAALFNPKTSINTGMFLATQEHRELFQEAVKAKEELAARNFPYPLGDQTAVNWAIHRSKKLSLNILPPKYNWQVFRHAPSKVPEGTHVIHVVGGTFEAPDLPSKYGWVELTCRRFPIRDVAAFRH